MFFKALWLPSTSQIIQSWFDGYYPNTLCLPFVISFWKIVSTKNLLVFISLTKKSLKPHIGEMTKGLRYYNGTQWAQWNESWFTWDSSTGCTSWTSFMYLNTTTGLWQYCSYGFYYDETLRGWRDCTGICTGAWGYQSIWFQCSSGQIYDTDLMKWVDTCIFPKVLHNDSQYSVRSVWRSSSFYIDSQSQSIIELGTKMHPFRFFKSALSEILNQYSHSNNSISVYVKENTELSITTNIAYLMNITSVSIKSYSNTSNSPKNANLIMSEQIQSQSIKTLFNILSNNNLQLDKVISQSQFNSNEVAIATQGNIIFSITRSNFSISNMTILSNSVFDQVFINCASAEIKQINIRDIYFNASGHIHWFYLTNLS